MKMRSIHKVVWGCFGSILLITFGIWHLNQLQPDENTNSKIESSYNFPKRQMDVRGFDYRFPRACPGESIALFKFNGFNKFSKKVVFL